MLAMLVGYTLGILAVLNWMVMLAYADQPAWLIGLAGGAVLGGVMGVAQWLILRRYTPINAWWVLAGSVGGALGLALGMPLADTLTLPLPVPAVRGVTTAIAWRVAVQAGVTGAAAGVVIGGTQWLVLRRFIRSAGLWIIVNGLGWMAALGLGAAITNGAGLFGALLFSGLAGGAITGIVMQRWLRRAK
jgi:hypothetical protein